MVKVITEEVPVRTVVETVTKTLYMTTNGYKYEDKEEAEKKQIEVNKWKKYEDIPRIFAENGKFSQWHYIRNETDLAIYNEFILNKFSDDRKTDKINIRGKIIVGEWVSDCQEYKNEDLGVCKGYSVISVLTLTEKRKEFNNFLNKFETALQSHS